MAEYEESESTLGPGSQVSTTTMEDTDKEGGPEGQAEKSQDSRDRCYDWLINVALLSNGINIGLNMGILGPSLPDLALQTASTLPEMSVIFIFSSIAYMIGSFACGLMLGRFEGYLVISLTLMLQAASTAVVPWCTNLTLLTGVISLSYFFATVIIAGTAYLCFRLERTRARVMTQAVFLLFNLGKSVVPFVVAPFLAQEGVITPVGPGPTPGNGSARSKPFKPIHWPDGWAAVLFPNRSSPADSPASLEDIEATPGSISSVGYGYVIVAGYTVLVGILYIVVALRSGCRLWAAPDPKKSTDFDKSTAVSNSIWRKAAVLAAFFIMIFLQCGMESVDAGLMMSLLSEYLNRSKEMGVIASSVYQGVKVLACIVVVLIVNRIHPSALLLVDLLFMLVATSLMTVSIYFNIGDALLWTTFVLLAIGMSNSYATMASWLETRYRITGMVTSILTIGFGLGSMVLPTLTTNLLDQKGPVMFPLVLLVSSILCFIFYFITKVAMKEQCCLPVDTVTDISISITKKDEKSHLLESSSTKTDGNTIAKDVQAPAQVHRTPRYRKRQSLSELTPDQCFHAYHSSFINKPTEPSEYTKIYEE